MSIWLGALIVVAVILLFSNLSLRANLKLTKELLELSKSANKQLEEKLYAANLQLKELQFERNNENKKPKIPAFLLADDPMDAVFKDVGRAK